MKLKSIFILFLLISVKDYSFGQHIYQVPYASVQPKFVFPLYIEEGTGMRDTLYFCYDPNADGNLFGSHDTIYGQKLVYTDTTKFYACLYNDQLCGSFPLQCDSQYKASVGQAITDIFPVALTAIFRNGILPIKISWDVSTLYSDSLPFQSTGITPKGQGRFSVNGSMLSISISENGDIYPSVVSFPYLISDSGGAGFKDSCTIFSINSTSIIAVENATMFLYFEQWTGIATGINETTLKMSCSVYPNPFEDHVTVLIPSEDEIQRISIYDLMGGKVFDEEFHTEQNSINLFLDTAPGLCLIKVEGKKSSYTTFIYRIH